MFKLMEDNSNLDFGEPGPMVHFMETYYKKGYEKLLLDSIRRCPISQTIWMVNRIINAPDFDDKQKYLDVLKSSLNRDDLSESVLSEIRRVLKYQKSKGTEETEEHHKIPRPTF